AAGAAAFDGRPEHLLVVARVVLEVGVLDDHELAGGLAKAAVQRGALAPVPELVEHVHPLAHDAVGDSAGAVGGAVVDDDQLANPRGLEDALDRLLDGGELVVTRHDHGQRALAWDHGEDGSGSTLPPSDMDQPVTTASAATPDAPAASETH